jgi:hypothetical protein
MEERAVIGSLPYSQVLGGTNQGTLTEGEGSVWLTSLRYLVGQFIFT